MQISAFQGKILVWKVGDKGSQFEFLNVYRFDSKDHIVHVLVEK